MLTPERFHDLLLDYQYDLLDDADRQAVEEYLSAHPEGRAEGARWQRLLGTAAKADFPGLRFEPPVVEPAHREPAEPVRPTMKRSWLRWAAVAGVLLAVGSVTAPLSQHLIGYYQTKTQLAEAQERLQGSSESLQKYVAGRRAAVDAVNRETREAAAEVERTQTELTERVEKAAREAEAKRLTLVITGPEAVQPGAPNEFNIVTLNRNESPTAAKLDVRVRDGDNRVVFEEKNIQSNGSRPFTLPADLPLKAGSKLNLEVVAHDGLGSAQEVSESLTLVGPRYVAGLSTDKPMYKPGETVFFRSLTLNRTTFAPPNEDFNVEFTLTDPSGAQVRQLIGQTRLTSLVDGLQKLVLGPDQKALRGVAAGEFKLDEEWPGGEYALTLRERDGRFPEETRKILINKYTPDRLNKELDFTRKTYSAGDEVVANCKVSNADGSPLQAMTAHAMVRVDEAAFPARVASQIDSNGCVKVVAVLPRKIAKGNATMTVTFDGSGVSEAIVRPIPLVLKHLAVEFYPEGGYLVAGTANRVYFTARTPTDKPAELRGRILDSKGETVATAETLNDDTEAGVNQGMGTFAFTPKAGESYTLKIDEPATVETAPKLPAIEVDRVAMTVPDGVAGGDRPIHVTLFSPGKDRELLVGAYGRGRLIDHQRVTAKADQPAAVVLKGDAEGVVRVTAFEEVGGTDQRRTLRPVAERLTFRKPTRKVTWTVQPDKSRYAPGEPVKLTLTATDEKGQPTRAVGFVAVVNETIFKMADVKTDRALPTHFLIAGEVRKAEDLEYADFLVGDHPKAAKALDLLLGTQGWRRFAEQNPTDFRNRSQNDRLARESAERLLVMTGTQMKQVSTRLEEERVRIANEIQPKLTASYDRVDRARDEAAKLSDERAFRTGLKVRRDSETFDRNDYTNRLAMHVPFERAHRTLIAGAMYGGAFAAFVVGVICVAVALVRGMRRAVPFYMAAGTALVACLLLVVAIATTGDSTAKFGQVVRSDVSSTMPSPELPAQTAPNDPNDPEFGDDKDKGEKGDPKDGAKNLPKMMEAEGRERFAAPVPKGPGGPGMGVPDGAPPPPAPPGMAAPAMARPAAPMPVAPVVAPPKPEADPAAAKPAEMEKVQPALDRPPAKRADERDNKFDDAQKGKPFAQPPGKPMAEGTARQKMDPRRDAKGDVAREPNKDFDRIGNVKKTQGRPNAMELAQRRKEAGGKGGSIPARGGFGGAEAAGGPAGVPAGAGGGAGRPGMPGGGRAMRGGGFPGGGPGGLPVPGDMPGPDGLVRLQMAVQEPAPPMVIREYANFRGPTAPDEERTKFEETVYWHPAVVLAEGGKAEVGFHLSDAVTRYRITVAGHTLDGRLGGHTQEIESRKPFSVEAKLPVELSAGDKLDVPVVIVNDTDGQRAVRVDVTPAGLTLVTGTNGESVVLTPNQRTRRVFRFTPALVRGTATLAIEGKSEPFAADVLKRSMPIVPEGFPVLGSHSDLLEGRAESKIVLPQDYVRGTLKLHLNLYPSTLADLQSGLEGMLREPGGCFEQTSSSSYPNTLILDYLKESDQANPEVARRAKEMLERGYKKLTSFECIKSGNAGREGFEWFGGHAPPHEALTAYGLLQFRDLARVQEVDQAMVQRTRQYLLDKRTKDGSFARNSRALDTFGRAPAEITDAYLVWALTETGDDDLTPELARLLNLKSRDPYLLSLLANALLNRNRTDEATALLKQVVAAQDKTGAVTGANTSITSSGGRDLQIETTALAVLAWLKANRPEFTEPTRQAIKWIGTQRSGSGGFGATQSTILALKALIGFTKASKKTPEAGEVALWVGTEKIGHAAFPAEQRDAVVLEVENPEKFLKPGENVVRATLSTKAGLPFTLGWSFHTLTPASAEACQVRLATKLDRAQATEGQSVRMTASIENVAAAGKGLPMTVAVIGLPAGLKVPEDMKQLKEMAKLRNNDTEAGEIAFFEIRNRDLVLYWRDLKPGQKIEVGIDLICDIPGEFRGSASRAYLYYNADHKHWVSPLEIAIVPVVAAE